MNEQVEVNENTELSSGERREPHRHIKRGMCLKVIVFGSWPSSSSLVLGRSPKISRPDHRVEGEVIDTGGGGRGGRRGESGAHSLTHCVWEFGSLLRSRRQTDRAIVAWKC